MPLPRPVRVFLVVLSGCLAACGPTSPVTSPTATAPGSSPTVSSAPPTTASPVASSPGNEPPGQSAWEPGGNLILGRPRTHIAALSGGQVLVVGSDNVCTPGVAWPESAPAEVGEPKDGVWTAAAGLPAPRDRFVLAPLEDGSILVTGGTTTEGPEIGPQSYSSTYIYRDGQWTRSGLLVTARSDPAGAVLADGRVLAAGGYYTDLPANPPPRVLESSELFDPASGEWTASGDLGTARYGASAVTLADGRVLVVGGFVTIDQGPAPLYGEALPVASAEVFDPATGRWASAGDLRLARSDFGLVALEDGGALVVGGTVYTDAGEFGFQREPTATTERLDPQSATWSAGPEMSVAAADRTVVRLADGRVLAAGGDTTVHEVDLDETPPALTADAEILDPQTGAWQATTQLPRPRGGSSAVLQDGSVVVAGGIMAHGSPEDTPSCPVPDQQVLRFVPGVPGAP